MNATAPDWPQVMVVEDDMMISATLEIALESRDYRVLGPVATLEEAYQLLETSEPDIALIDYRLAATTTEALLTSLNARQVPTCVLTGLRPDELPAAYAGCAVLQKPFRLDALLDALKQVRPG
ncbi:response regulator [Rhodanobacter panaciterrae]|uniref:Response regulator n=1 Tax=Rhodanobacter panaciterrae TaxID=490572 RepID=A0ABQ2ZPC1_9GAMM|nr:response regulator [Rhodanobacter panaciterrae]GGY18847.1 response regulator [Rhodanobacter panaciterrae]